MIPSVALTVLIYKYNISLGVYTPACDIPLLRSLFLSDTNIKQYWCPVKNKAITKTFNKQRRCEYITFRGACLLFL